VTLADKLRALGELAIEIADELEERGEPSPPVPKRAPRRPRRRHLPPRPNSDQPVSDLAVARAKRILRS